MNIKSIFLLLIVFLVFFTTLHLMLSYIAKNTFSKFDARTDPTIYMLKDGVIEEQYIFDVKFVNDNLYFKDHNGDTHVFTGLFNASPKELIITDKDFGAHNPMCFSVSEQSGYLFISNLTNKYNFPPIKVDDIKNFNQ